MEKGQLLPNFLLQLFGFSAPIIWNLKGDLSCKMHFCTSFIHEYVSPVFQGTHQVSENTTLSIFLHTQIAKKGAATDLIKTDPDLNTVLTSGQWRYGYWANSTNQEETATAIAVRKRWRRCSTYARPVDGAVLTESTLAKTELKKCKLSEMRHG